MKISKHPEAELPYILYLPDNIDAQETWHLIVFLHGYGEGGIDLDLVRKWGVPKYLDTGHDIPAIVYAPQSQKDVWWNIVQDKVLAGIDTLCQTYSIGKIHLTGFSMGGHGTCYIGVKHHERFASIAPVATYMLPQSDVTEEVCVLKDKPVWIFHSEADHVPVGHSDKVVENLRACEASQLKYTRLTDADHVETADIAYFDEEFYEWMLK